MHMAGEMRIRTWTAHGWDDYSARVQPKMHAFFSSLGGNSIYAELSVDAALRCLVGAQHVDVSIRAAVIANDLRIVLRCAEGTFPAEAVYRYVRECADGRRAQRPVTELPPEHRNIWRILMPVKLACVDRSGKKVTLLFQHPFMRNVRQSLGALAWRLRMEHEAMIR